MANIVHAPPKNGTSHRAEYWVMGSIFITAVLLRFVGLGLHPGYEWDEPVYTSVAGNLVTYGLLELKPEYYRSGFEAYLYHPPFYFGLLAGWFWVFGVSIEAARYLAALGSIVMLLLLYPILRNVMGWRWAAVAIGLLSIDAWLVFTNRVSWIENTMMPIGVAGLLLYLRFVLLDSKGTMRRERRSSQWAWIITAGCLIGAVTVYKHVGIYFLFTIVICGLITHRHLRRHIVLLSGFGVVMLGYVAGMAIFFQDTFVNQVATQFRRSTGTQEARGALTSIADVLGPLTSQYSIYWPSVLLVGVAVILLFLRFISLIRRRSTLTPGEALLTSWAAASVIFFIVLQLKIPHYFLMLEVPLLCYLVLEVRRLATSNRRRIKIETWMAVAIATLLVVANGYALVQRMLVLDGNPLAATAAWTAENLPGDATIVTEESVGTVISQPYCKMAFARNCTDADYIITYTSSTQKVPDSRSVEVMLENAQLLQSFSGFKEDIRIYRIR